MAASRKEVEAFVQCMQQFHSKLPSGQQRMLECCLDAARQCQSTGQPDVQGYMGSPGQSWSSLCDCICQWQESQGQGQGQQRSGGQQSR